MIKGGEYEVRQQAMPITGGLLIHWRANFRKCVRGLFWQWVPLVVHEELKIRRKLVENGMGRSELILPRSMVL